MNSSTWSASKYQQGTRLTNSNQGNKWMFQSSWSPMVTVERLTKLSGASTHPSPWLDKSASIGDEWRIDSNDTYEWFVLIWAGYCASARMILLQSCNRTIICESWRWWNVWWWYGLYYLWTWRRSIAYFNVSRVLDSCVLSGRYVCMYVCMYLLVSMLPGCYLRYISLVEFALLLHHRHHWSARSCRESLIHASTAGPRVIKSISSRFSQMILSCRIELNLYSC